jgi:ABC-type Fe3+-siderophore transport system permease subunit
MTFDLRLPIGIIFTIYGFLLTAFGVFSNKEQYARSLGININLIWGIVMLVFGLLMLYFAKRSKKS